MIKMKKTLTIIMPVYNENGTVVEAIEHTKQVDIGGYNKEIIVIDDGSTDGSRELIQKTDGVKKVLLERNRGKGGALKEGIKQATGDFVVFHDADMEYEPGDFRYMLPILDSGLADVVIGSRFVGRKQYLFGSRKNVIFKNYIGNMLIKLVWNFLYQHNLTDVYPCYKVMRLSDLKELTIKADRFVFDLEMMLKLKKKDKVFVEVPIHFRYRGYDKGKKIGMGVGFQSIWYMFRYRFFD